MPSTSIYLKAETKLLLDKLSQATGLSPGKLISEAVASRIESLVDVARSAGSTQAQLQAAITQDLELSRPVTERRFREFSSTLDGLSYEFKELKKEFARHLVDYERKKGQGY